MTAPYYTLLTNIGAAKLANATATDTPLSITQMGVGDANGTTPIPDPGQTSLIHECRRADLNTLKTDPNNPNQIIAEQVLPDNVGGWYIRELGLYDADGDLIAVGNCPPSYKPLIEEGASREQVIRMILIVTSDNAVTLKIDPAVVLATREYVDDSIEAHAKSRNHPNATTEDKGFVQLSSETDSDDETKAATPKAVKEAYDLANGKLSSVPDATTAQKGIVQLSSATNSDDEIHAATPKAVKAAYDLANGKLSSVPDATTAQKGIVQLSSVTDSDSETAAATPKAIKAVKAIADAALPATGNAASATKLQMARKIGGAAFDGTADINLPGVNTAGNQATSGNAGSATKLQTARTINGVAFDGTANITIPASSIGSYTKAESDARYNLKNTASKSVNSMYTKDASTGVITIAMSNINVPNNTPTTVTFPTAFPNACVSVVISYDGAGHGKDSDSAYAVTAYSKTGCTITAWNADGKFMLTAKGY